MGVTIHKSIRLPLIAFAGRTVTDRLRPSFPYPGEIFVDLKSEALIEPFDAAAIGQGHGRITGPLQTASKFPLRWWLINSIAKLAKIVFTPVRNEGGARRCAEIRDTVHTLCYKSPAWIACTGEPCGCRLTTSRNCNSSLLTISSGATK
jgi:hypothetical protein